MNRRDATTPEPHPATAKAWAWFEEQQNDMGYDRRERIALALARLDAELWKLDHPEAERGN